MNIKYFLYLLPLSILLFTVPVQATEEVTTSPSAAQEQSVTSTQSSSGPLSGLVKDEGIRDIKAIDLLTLGDKALDYGNKSYETLKKGSIPMFVWSMAASVFLMLLGILFGKRVLALGVSGIMISLIVFTIVHFMPEIALTFKESAQGFLK